MERRRRRTLVTIGGLLALGAWSLVFLWPHHSLAPHENKNSSLPDRVSASPSPTQEIPSPSPTVFSFLPPSSVPSSRPSRILLDVPFMSQAPSGSWEEPYQNACEEAALMMARAWQIGTRPSRTEAHAELLRLIDFETKKFGFYKDTSTAQTVELFMDFYENDAISLVPSATIDDVKDALAQGDVVLLPMAGRKLDGPFYRPPGPLYHMLVIRGYDEATQEFVVNDDGTNTKGEAFRFSYDAIKRSWNDWDSEHHALASSDVPTPMIVVRKTEKLKEQK